MDPQNTETPSAQTPAPSTDQPQTSPETEQQPTPDSSGNKKSKLPLIIGGSVLVGLLLVGLIGWLLYSLLFSVTKEDYADATRSLNSVVGKASASISDVTSIAYITSYSTETKTKNDVDSAKDSLEEYKKANAELKDHKALRDEDVKLAYDAYMDKYDAYIAFADGYVKSAEEALLAVIECESISSTSVSDVASYKAAIAPCEDALENTESVTDKDLKSFIAAYKDNVDEVTRLVEESASLSARDYTRLSRIRTQIYGTTDKLRNAQKDANSNIEKRLKDANPREEYNALADILTDKQRD